MLLTRILAGFFVFLPLFSLTTEPVFAEIRSEVTVVSELMFGPHSDYHPVKWYEENGCRYGLERWELESVTLSPRPEHVEQEVLFEQVEDKDLLPAVRTILLEEEFSGLSIEEAYPVTEMKKMKERWQDGFSFPVVFHSYGAQAYRLGGQEVAADKEKPLSKAWEKALLAEIGVEPERYRVMDTKWDGAPYFDENNIFCRNAVATGEKLVADYLVTYGGTAIFPEVEGFRCLAVYSLDEPVMVQAKDKKIISQADQEKPVNLNWVFKTRLVVLTVSAVVLLALLLISVWLMRRLMRRKVREEKKE